MRNHTLLHVIYGYAPTVIMGLVSGLCIVISIVSYHAYFVTSANYEELRLQSQRLLQRSLLLYGHVESVDLANSTARIRFRNQFVAAEEPVHLTVHIGEKTQIVRQTLIGTNGVYSAISDVAVGTLADIVPGMRVAVHLENIPDDERIEARVIMFGDPL